MKSFKLLAIGAAAMAATAMAHAATIGPIYITGSSAFRSETHKAIISLLGGNVGALTLSTGGYTYTGTDVLAAGQASFTGVVGADTVIIKTSWSGSAAGIQTVAQNGTPAINVNFLTADSGAVAGTPSASGTSGQLPDVAMADNEQGSTLFNGKFLRTTAYSNLTATQVGIVPFVWVKSNPTGLTGAAATRWSALTNMTAQLARAQWTNGSGILPLYQYTAAQTDIDTPVDVYAAGRDPDSGTRIVAFAEPGIGVNTGVIQFIPGVTSPNNGQYAATTINGVPIAQGNSGESSGGNLKTKFNLTTLTRIYVSYMGVSDANGLTAANSQLTYNGVAYSPEAIKNGQYTFWGIENLMYKSGLVTAKKTIANSLANTIKTITAIKIDDMLVGRAGDGGTVN